jgi:hypothetical protein
MLREFHAITATHQTLTKFLCCETAEPGQADHVARYTRYGNFFFFASFLPWRLFLFLPQVLSELILVNNLPCSLFFLFPLSSPFIFPSLYPHHKNNTYSIMSYGGGGYSRGGDSYR